MAVQSKSILSSKWSPLKYLQIAIVILLKSALFPSKYSPFLHLVFVLRRREDRMPCFDKRKPDFLLTESLCSPSNLEPGGQTEVLPLCWNSCFEGSWFMGGATQESVLHTCLDQLRRVQISLYKANCTIFLSVILSYHSTNFYWVPSIELLDK